MAAIMTRPPTRCEEPRRPSRPDHLVASCSFSKIRSPWPAAAHDPALRSTLEVVQSVDEVQALGAAHIGSVRGRFFVEAAAR